MTASALSPSVYRQLVRHVEGEVAVDDVTRTLYSTDASIYRIVPLAVVFPRTAADLEAVVSIAHETSTPFIVRGAGSGLAGETLGRAIVADCSRHLTKILEVDTQRGFVRAEPGVVVDSLDAHLAPQGKMFGPDPGSSSRATLGGVVANNSAGMHSLVHGAARDHVLSLDLILSDGSWMRVGADSPRPAGDGLAARIWDGTQALLSTHAELIESKTPRRLRRHRAGYLMHDVLRSDGTMDIAKLICGSEGTLAAIAAVNLRILDPLRATGVGLFNFAAVAEAADAVASILNHNPVSVEMLDETILRMAREARRLDADLVDDSARSTLLVEFEGESPTEVADKLARLERDLRAHTPVLASGALATDARSRARIWAVRSSSQPLLYKRPGRKNPITLFEDIAVEPERLGDLVRAIDQALGSRGIEYGAFGHAGAGLLHTRPFIDLRDPEDIRLVRECADEIYDAAFAMGGTVSGEHGDGLARTHLLPRQYGELYPVFGEVKRLFDPKGILNPDKIWRPEPRDTSLENLKLHPGLSYAPRDTLLVWRDGEFENELDRCNACGECRVLARDQAMCPLYKLLKDERAAPRAKATLIRSLMNGTLDDGFFSDPTAKQAMDYCIDCKACRLECPLNVNIPKLMLEAKAEYVRRNGQSVENLVLSASDRISRLASAAAPLANAALRAWPVRKIVEWTAGLDVRRDLPPFRFTPMRRFRAVCPHPESPIAKAAVFLDVYPRYNDPQLTFDFLDVLRANRVEAVVPTQRACGLPAMSYAGIETARRTVEFNARAFSPYIDQGYTVVAMESSAALALREESLDFCDSPLARKLAEHTMDAMSFLEQLRARGELQTDGLSPVSIKVGYHTPCHVKALDGARQATMNLMSLVPGLEIAEIREGCCGIAGTYGLKRANRDRSMRMGEHLFRALREDGIEKGMSECSTCRMQMEEGSGKSAIHPIALLARAYRASSPKSSSNRARIRRSASFHPETSASGDDVSHGTDCV
ncbi:anaerobic glycerol-3-phosphate dehydrogenase subunit C [Candidatus Sumerlaeota bacterium]|nr:anaerobic glycerol-3-phosphate dehydrogenase subunit C [Candidatus Sumerlaeota bacterium]